MSNGGWILLEVYCERYGERQNTVQKRVHDGIWERGVHYSRATGHESYIHEPSARKWLQEKGKLHETEAT